MSSILTIQHALAMKIKMQLLLLTPVLLFCSMGAHGPLKSGGPYRCTNGKISFRSEATLEVIQASSNQLTGALDPSNNTFAWAVQTVSFQGFNGALQREHFNENYMESGKYPRLTFLGKIIEKVDFQKDGKYAVRAKGRLSAHGVEQERIIRSDIEVVGNKILVHAEFTVLLSDHNIRIPQIVHQKIAEEVLLRVEAVLVASGN